MISEIIMPDLGATGRDVTIEQWLVQPGERVRAGQALFVVNTDKATVEVEAFRDGVLREVRVPVGAEVPLGAVVAVIADSMDEQAAIEQSAGPLALPATPLSVPEPSATQKEGYRSYASPLARRMAQSEGISLTALKGSGTHGQILKRDVVAALESRQPAPPLHNGASRREPLTAMRRAIAARTQRSMTDAPHFYATIIADMTGVIDLRQQAAVWAEANGWPTPTITDVCLRAAALALRQHPAINASFDGDAILYHDTINVGLVIGLPDGMLIPVIRHADRLNLYTLAGTTRRLRQGAESGTLSAADLSGGTFTVSNLGMYGVDSFTAVINPPEAGILALGAVAERPAVINGAVVPRAQMTAVLSIDHRAVDGIVAAQFIATFKSLLENPIALTLDPPQQEAS